MTSTNTRIAQTSELTAGRTLERALHISPAFTRGIWITLALAVLGSVGKIVVPMAIQRTLDEAILVDDGPIISTAVRWAVTALVILIAASASQTFANFRLVRQAEAGLRELREAAFAHIHRLSILTQGSERRGSLVSRVTSDVDTISFFVQWGGLMLLVSMLQLGAATILMAIYSWQLTLLVWACFIPLMVFLPKAQRRVSKAFGLVRTNVGTMLGAMSEAIVGAETVRVFGIQNRTRAKLAVTIEKTRSSTVRALIRVGLVFATGVTASNLVLAVVVVAGALLGLGGSITAGQLVAFLFLVSLFTGPLQMATEILNELQNAIAGWRRVIGIIDTPVDVDDPAEPAPAPARGTGELTIANLRYAYPGGKDVLHDVTFDIGQGSRVALVGETGSGKTTLAKLMARIIDPTAGSIRLGDTELRDMTLAELRNRIQLVPQEGFLFDDSILVNIAYGSPYHEVDESTQHEVVTEALRTLGLTPWLDTLPQGLHTPTGQRGEWLSAGERQLVAVTRAYLADADVLILDEATSAVDPATEVALARALDQLMATRTTITIAHRLSTAQASDVVIVMDEGNLAQYGHHDELADTPGPYRDMFQAWLTQSRT